MFYGFSKITDSFSVVCSLTIKRIFHLTSKLGSRFAYVSCWNMPLKAKILGGYSEVPDFQAIILYCIQFPVTGRNIAKNHKNVALVIAFIGLDVIRDRIQWQ